MIFQDIIHKFSSLIVKKLKANNHFYQSSHGSIKLAKRHRQLKINELKAANQYALKHLFRKSEIQNYLLTICLLTVI